MDMMKDNQLEFIGKKSELCAGDAQARYLVWKMKKMKMVQLDWLTMAKGKGLNDQLVS